MIGVIVCLVLSLFFRPLQCLQDQELSCGIPRKNIVGLIRGGKIVDAQEHPWHSVLFHWNGFDWEYQCGGTLINIRFVLTARHCTLINGIGRPVPINQLLVRLGLQEMGYENLHSQKYSVSAIHTIKGKILDKFRNDIALIQLNQSAQLTEHILPACLVNRDATVNEIGTVVGFGITENKTLSKLLRVLSVPVLNPVSCLRRHTEFVHLIDENQFCAGHTDGRSVCNGDSGGGLLFRRNGTMQLGGIVSFTAARGMHDYRCKEDGYAVYTNVYYYLSWIEQIITDSNEQRKHCGTLSSNTVLTLMIYTLELSWNDHHYWQRVFEGAVISHRYILVTGFLGLNVFRAALYDKEYCYKEIFSKIFYRDVDSIAIHPASQDRIALFHVDQDIPFNGQVQPICLPTLKEIQSDVPILYGSSNSADKTLSLYNLTRCRTECESYLKTDELFTDMLCVGNVTSNDTGSFVGFYSSWKGIRRFVLVGGRSHICHNGFALFIKFNYESHIKWIYEIMENYLN